MRIDDGVLRTESVSCEVARLRAGDVGGVTGENIVRELVVRLEQRAGADWRVATVDDVGDVLVQRVAVALPLGLT